MPVLLMDRDADESVLRPKLVCGLELLIFGAAVLIFGARPRELCGRAWLADFFVLPPWLVCGLELLLERDCDIALCCCCCQYVAKLVYF